MINVRIQGVKLGYIFLLHQWQRLLNCGLSSQNKNIPDWGIATNGFAPSNCSNCLGCKRAAESHPSLRAEAQYPPGTLSTFCKVYRSLVTCFDEASRALSETVRSLPFQASLCSTWADFPCLHSENTSSILQRIVQNQIGLKCPFRFLIRSIVLNSPYRWQVRFRIGER